MSRNRGESRVEYLRATLGFDRARLVKGVPSYVAVGCSQCEALCINGTPCHEHGCPNAIKDITQDQEEA